MPNFLDQIQWDAQGLVPVIAQEWATGDVLMLAWMNREALRLTCQTRRAVYYSRSRQKLWVKGESSGHTQAVQDIRLDCDNDVVLLKVVVGGAMSAGVAQATTGTGTAQTIACHTGRHSCFFQQHQDDSAGGRWVAVDPVLQGSRHS